MTALHSNFNGIGHIIASGETHKFCALTAPFSAVQILMLEIENTLFVRVSATTARPSTNFY